MRKLRTELYSDVYARMSLKFRGILDVNLFNHIRHNAFKDGANNDWWFAIGNRVVIRIEETK